MGQIYDIPEEIPLPAPPCLHEDPPQLPPRQHADISTI